MANPNLVNVGTIRGQTAYVIPSAVTVSVAWTYDGITSLPGLTPAVNTVNKINSIMVSNVSGAAATITVGVSNNATYASGTPYYLAFQIAVPVGATLIIVDKTTPLYITENQSVGVIVGTASALNIVATFDVLT
jgi:hypothetical protein